MCRLGVGLLLLGRRGLVVWEFERAGTSRSLRLNVIFNGTIAYTLLSALSRLVS
jgi:hypothetical protein